MTDRETRPARVDDATDDATHDVSEGISEMARALFAAGDVTATLQRLIALATASIDGCDHAGVFVVEAGRVTAPASTGPVAAELDALQQQLGEGPCLDAITGARIIYGADLAGDTPWTVWAPAAVAAGVRSSLSLSTGTAEPDSRRGALNCYSAFPDAFGALDRGKALVLATLGGLALAAADDKDQAEVRAGGLQTALVTREIIGQAQGILMERDRLSADQAFDLLRRASQHLNVKLRDIAQKVVDTGRPPLPEASLQ